MAWSTRYERLQQQRKKEEELRLDFTHTRSALIRALRAIPELAHLRGFFFLFLSELPKDSSRYKRETFEDRMVWEASERCWVRSRCFYEVWQVEEVIDFIGEMAGICCRACGQKKYDVSHIVSEECIVCHPCGKRFMSWCHRTRDYREDDSMLFEQWLTKAVRLKAKEIRLQGKQ